MKLGISGKGKSSINFDEIKLNIPQQTNSYYKKQNLCITQKEGRQMKDLLELVRNRYQKLNEKLNLAREEEAKFDSEKSRLAFDFKIKDDAYEDACKHFDKIEKRINERKEKYVKENSLTHKKTIFSAVASIATLTIGIGMLFGAITNPLFLPIVGSFTIATLIDLKTSWKYIKKELEEKFEELESTKRIRDISDKAYVNKIQKERELREVQAEIIDNTRKLNLAKAKRISIENEIMGVKVETFDLIVDEKNTAEELVLRK